MESHVTCSLSAHRQPLCSSGRHDSRGSGTERCFPCTGRDIGLQRGGVRHGAQSSCSSSRWLHDGGGRPRERRGTERPLPAACLVIHVHHRHSCTVCRTLWTTTADQLSRM